MYNLLNDWSNELNPNRNQLIFIDKNQTYGAFVLRKDYTRNLLFSLLLTSFFLISGIYLLQFMNPATEIPTPPRSMIDDAILMVEDINLKPSPTIQKPKSTAPAPPDQTAPAVQTPNDVSITQVNLSTNPANVTVNPQVTQSTQPTAPTTNSPGDGPGSNGTGTTSTPTDNTSSNQPLIGSEVMPEFEGGQAALFNFLKNKTQYPASAREVGLEGVSYVRFVVAKDGSIQNIEILRSGGSAFDKEAIRVISSMPKWKPGMQDGKPVSVYFTIPFRFTLQD